MSYPKKSKSGLGLFLLLLSSSFLINISQVMAVSSMPQKIHEKYIMESFNELCNEDVDSKTRFANDVEIKFCFIGMKEGNCIDGNFDDTFGLIIQRGCAKFTGDPRGFRSSISDTSGVVSFVLYFATKEDACVSNTATTSYHELNSEGKTSKLYVYSDDGTEFMKCLGLKEEEDKSDEAKQTTEKEEEEVKKEEETASTNNEL